MFTRQETFDMSCLALVEQGKPGYDCKAYSCRYLTEEGCRCAAGHLMTDATAEVLCTLSCGPRHPRAAALLQGHDLDLVALLQADHDEGAYATAGGDVGLAVWRLGWLRRILGTARRFGLDPTRVLEAARAKGWTIPEGLS